MRTPLLTSLILLASSTTASCAGRISSRPAPAAPPRRRRAQPAPAAAPPPEKPVVVPVPRRRRHSTVPVAGPPPAGTGVPATVPQLSESTVKVGLQRLPCSRLSRLPAPRHQVRVAVADVPRHAVAVHALHRRRREVRHRPFGLGMGRQLVREVRAIEHRPAASRRTTSSTGRRSRRMLLRVTPTYAIDREHFIQGQVELVGTGDQTIAPHRCRRRGHRRPLAPHRQVEPVGLPGRPLRRLGGLSPRHGPRLQHLRAARARSRRGNPASRSTA